MPQARPLPLFPGVGGGRSLRVLPPAFLRAVALRAGQEGHWQRGLGSSSGPQAVQRLHASGAAGGATTAGQPGAPKLPQVCACGAEHPHLGGSASPSAFGLSGDLLRSARGSCQALEPLRRPRALKMPPKAALAKAKALMAELKAKAVAAAKAEPESKATMSSWRAKAAAAKRRGNDKAAELFAAAKVRARPAALLARPAAALPPARRRLPGTARPPPRVHPVLFCRRLPARVPAC